jgi:hypothetical protein
MTEPFDADDREPHLRKLATTSLEAFHGSFGELDRVVSDMKSVIRSLEGLVDPVWLASLTKQWGQLEIIFAVALDEGRSALTPEEEAAAEAAVARMLYEFRAND